MNDYIYIFYYPTEKYKCNNKLLVIGFLRKFFGFKFFYYIHL